MSERTLAKRTGHVFVTAPDCIVLDKPLLARWLGEKVEVTIRLLPLKKAQT